MTIDTASSTAVNSAIMAAADQILAGLKGGIMFPSAPPDAPTGLPISHVAASIGEANKTVNLSKTELSRCSPTGVHQQEHLKEAHTAYSYVNDGNCVSHSSQVTFEEPNNDMNKIASASSLTSSEHSHGDRQVMEVGVPPPMQQVTFTSGAPDSRENKRSLPPPSQDDAAVEPSTQRPRLHKDPNVPTPGEGDPVVVAQAGGQEGPPAATQGEWPSQVPEDQQQGRQAPGQTTYQPILPAPASHERTQYDTPVHAPQPQVQQYAPLQPRPMHQAPAKDQHCNQTAVQGHWVQGPSPAAHPASAEGSGHAPPPIKATTQAQGPGVAFAQAHAQPGHQEGYHSRVQPTATVQQSYPARQVSIAPAPTSDVKRQQPQQAVYYSQHQPSQGQPTTGQAYSTVHQPIAQTPLESQGMVQHSGQGAPYGPPSPTTEKGPADSSAPAPPPTTHYHHQDTSYSQIQPRPPPAQPPTNTYQQILPRPCPTLQHQDYQPQQKPASSEPEQEAYKEKHLPQFVFKCGMPTIPRTAHIETSSIQLDYTNHQQPHHSQSLGSQQEVAATLAAAPSPSAHSYHVPHNSASHGSALPQSNTAASILRQPSFPPPLAAKPMATAPTPPATAQAPPDVTSNLRNQRMQPTDCLLFAASLLQESPATAPPATAPQAASDSHVSPAFHHNQAGASPHAHTQHHSQVNGQRLLPPQYSVQQDPSMAHAPVAQAPVPAAASLSLPAHPSSPPLYQAPQAQDQPRDMDVLCGRGGLINKHNGNIIYRRVVEHNKPFYQSVQKRHRILVSQSIVHTILNRGGRFLSEDTQTITDSDGTRKTVTLWKPVPTSRAIQKTSQALRERVANRDSCSAATKEGGKGGVSMVQRANHSAV